MILIIFALNCNVSQASASIADPTEVWDLDINGKYTGSGKANSSNLYSNYNFTGVKKFKIQVKNRSSKNNLKVKVLKSIDNWPDQTVSKADIPKKGTTTWNVSVDKSAKYYIKFEAPCDFSWSIQKGK